MASRPHSEGVQPAIPKFSCKTNKKKWIAAQRGHRHGQQRRAKIPASTRSLGQHRGRPCPRRGRSMGDRPPDVPLSEEPALSLSKGLALCLVTHQPQCERPKAHPPVRPASTQRPPCVGEAVPFSLVMA